MITQSVIHTHWNPADPREFTQMISREEDGFRKRTTVQRILLNGLKQTIATELLSGVLDEPLSSK